MEISLSNHHQCSSPEELCTLDLISIPVAVVLDPRIYATLYVFHAFTGCDTTLSFAGRGQEDGVERFLRAFVHMQENLDSATISTLQCFIVLIYCTTVQRVFFKGCIFRGFRGKGPVR